NLARPERQAAAGLQGVVAFEPSDVVEELKSFWVVMRGWVPLAPRFLLFWNCIWLTAEVTELILTPRIPAFCAGLVPKSIEVIRNLIEDHPKRNSFSQLLLSVCVSFRARLCALMLPSPAPNVVPASPCGSVAGRLRWVFSKLYRPKTRL